MQEPTCHQLKKRVRQLEKVVADRRRLDSSLRQAETRYRNLFDQAADAIVVFNPRTLAIEDSNDEACRMLGYSRKEFASLRLSDIDAIESARQLVQHGSKIPTHKVVVFETRQRTKGGELLDVEIRASAFRADGRRLIQGVWRNITERKRAEEMMRRLNATLEKRVAAQTAALRESEARLMRVIEGSNDGYWEVDLSADRVTLSPRCRQILRLPADREAVTQGDVWRFIHPADVARVRKALASCMAKGEGVARCELEHRVRNGDSTVWVSARVMVTQRDAAGNVLRLSGMMTDITDRKKAEEEIVNRSRQLVELASELTVTEHRERRRLAGQIHDHLQQLLVAARFRLHAMANGRSEQDRRELAQLETILDEALNSARAITRDIAPPANVHKDIHAAMQWLAREMNTRHQLAVSLQMAPMTPDLTEAASVLLYTAARELLLNVVKHAGCREASLTLEQEPDAVVLTVRDKGKGASRRVLTDHAENHGFGWFSIRERAELLGGQFDVRTAPGKGMRVRLRIPIRG